MLCAVVLIVIEQKFAAVIFKNLANDGEAEPCALLACRDIGFGQPVTIFFRQADSIIANSDADATTAHYRQIDCDLPLRRITGGNAGADRFRCVFQYIGERLADQPAVAIEHDWPRRRVALKCNLGMRNALQEHRLPDQFLHVLAADNRHRHARKGREFIDHAADIANLPDDGVGALREDVGLGRNFARIFALQPFG